MCLLLLCVHFFFAACPHIVFATAVLNIMPRGIKNRYVHFRKKEGKLYVKYRRHEKVIKQPPTPEQREMEAAVNLTPGQSKEASDLLAALKQKHPNQADLKDMLKKAQNRLKNATAAKRAAEAEIGKIKSEIRAFKSRQSDGTKQ